MTIEIFIIILCLMINAVLVGIETAFIATSRSALRDLAKQGDEKAKSLLSLREHPERTLSTVQLGITFFAFFAAAIGGVAADESLSPWLKAHFGIKGSFATIVSLYFVVLPLIYANLVISELVPKMVALRNPLYFALQSAPWLLKSSRLMYPFVFILEWSTRKVAAFFHRWIHEAPVHLETSIEDLSLQNKQYVINIVAIEKTTVREIMLAWKAVVLTEWHKTVEEVENTIIVSGHTRLPVVENNEVRGILNAKEFFAFQKTGRQTWQSLIRPAVKVPENTPLLSALRRMQEQRAHMAIIYHGTDPLGIVTMEDIFEEIVGDIYDEDDNGAILKILSSIRLKG